MEDELVKNHASIAMRYCRRYASRHPLLVFMIFVLIWIYRSFPVLFYLLINASPVIVSTCVLLGTLLNFGHQNAPEIRKGRKPDHQEIFNFKTRVIGDIEIGERGVRNEVHEKAFGKNTFVVNNDRPRVDIDKFGSSIDSSVLRANKKVSQDSNSVAGNQKRDLGEERVVFVNRCGHFEPLEARTTETKSGGKLGGDLVDHLEGVKRFQQKYEDSKGWETGSEHAETSSPTASMSDIFPIVDDLQPLLESEVPQHFRMSNVSTDVTSDDYDDEDQEEEDVNVNEKEVVNAITWTEDGQKNLMNFGTSELERNTHLKNLIARQKALKNMRMLAEKNMASISADLPSNSTNSSTARKNLFDLPYESNVNIVGSAPSVMMPKRNSFDRLPDLNGKKPDPAGSDFQSNSVSLQPNDQLRHGHKSFDVGPSASGPYFAPERIASEETDYSLMHREMVEDSDSKVSSTPDTESIDSAHTQDHSPEADTYSIKEGSIASAHTEDYRAREADLNSIKEGYCTSEVNEHVSQQSRSFDDDDTLKLSQEPKRDGSLEEAKTSVVEETGYQGKSSSESSLSSFSNVTDHIDDDDEDEFRSTVMPLSPDSKKPQVQEQAKEDSPSFNTTPTAEHASSGVDDSGYNSDTKKHDDHSETDDNTEEPGFPQRLSQMHQGLTSWFGWKA